MIAKRPTLNDIVDLIDWLSAKVNNEGENATYDPGHPRFCMVCQYLNDRGFTNVSFSGSCWVNANGNSIQLPPELHEVAYGLLGAASRQESFSRARSRALKVMVAFKS